MDLSIRGARSGDLASLVPLLDGVVVPDPPGSIDLAPYEAAWSEILASDHVEVLVADVDGEVIGMCQLTFIRQLEDSGGLVAEIESMHVREDRRSDGIAGELLGAALERARAAGCFMAQMTKQKDRPGAVAMYVSRGFVARDEGLKLMLEPGTSSLSG